MKIGVVDYGVGNLGSVMQALEEVRGAPTLLTRATEIHAMDALILPGVGNFADCARLLNDGGWTQALQDEVGVSRKPLLGVCVGMQLLATCSTEGSEKGEAESTPGLGLIPGRVEHLRVLGCTLRVPHVGWNAVLPQISNGGLFDGIRGGTDFYFVHSYAFEPDDQANILATTTYDVRLTAAVHCGNVWGTQFHPEKSSRAGFRLLRNFLECAYTC